MAANAPTEPVALTAAEVVERLIGGLGRAEWDYDPEIDTMELFLPGWEGRAGVATLVGDDLYVRLDVETRAPLSIIIHAWTWWLGQHGVLQPDVLAALPDTGTLPAPARRAAMDALARTVHTHRKDLTPTR
jgi:hypothetical protein